MSSIYRVGDLTLDAGRQEVRRGAEPVHLGPLTYRLLLTLIEAAPDLVGHDALADAVWPGRVVSPETVSQRVKLLREAIGDKPHEPRYIELLRGRGYRLIPPVAVVPPGETKRRWGRPIVVGALLALAAAAVTWRFSVPDPAAPSSVTIAVLPFADLSAAQDQGYLADGIAEEILNLLSRTTPLRVTARTSSFSFRDESADVATIAERLNVAYILEGSVRKSGTRIRITAQLVSAADGVHVWSDAYDREIGDALSLQEEIAGSVADALETNLVGEDRPARATAKRVVPEAFDAYLRGQQQLRIHSMISLAEAARYFEASVEIDPAFLPAYSSLGLIYVLQIVDIHVPVTENLPKLRAVVRQGLSLAPGDPGLIGLSGQLARYEGLAGLAEQRLGRALALDPSNVPVVKLHAMFKLDQSHPREALQAYHRLLRRDPLNSELYIGIWACHMDLGNARDAIAATMHYDDVAPGPSLIGTRLRAITRALLLGDIAGSIRDETQGAAESYAYPLLYYSLEDQETGDAAVQRQRQLLGPDELGTIQYTLAYRHLVRGETAEARALALEAFTARKDFSAAYDDYFVARLAIDALIAGGQAERAVELIERMAPVYATYRSRPEMHPREFSPAPYSVKGAFSSYPAFYFPDYIRALRAADDAAGAGNMLQHLEAIQQWRRERGLFIKERHVAEARILRGDVDGALDALEKAERDRTLYIAWHAFLLHNEIFAGIRHHPRFGGLIERVADEMRRQRTELGGPSPETAQATH